MFFPLNSPNHLLTSTDNEHAVTTVTKTNQSRQERTKKKGNAHGRIWTTFETNARAGEVVDAEEVRLLHPPHPAQQVDDMNPPNLSSSTAPLHTLHLPTLTLFNHKNELNTDHYSYVPM